MPLHVAHRVGADPGGGQGLDDHFGLGADAGSGETRLEGAVVVGRRAADHGTDGVAVGEGVFQAPQHHDPDPVAEDRARRPGVEGAAVAVGREDSAFVVEIAHILRQLHRHGTGQGQVTLVSEQRLAGDVHGAEAGGAGRLHAQGRPLEIELVGDPRGQEVGGVGDHRLLAAHGAQELGMRQQAEEVAAQGGATVDADGFVALASPVAGVLQRLPGTLEEEAMLRIHQLGFPRGVAEEGRVEELDPRQPGRRLDIAGILQDRSLDPSRQQLLVAERVDRLDSPRQVAPVLVQVASAGETSRHSDDGDAREIGLVSRSGSHGRSAGLRLLARPGISAEALLRRLLDLPREANRRPCSAR